MTHDPHPKAPGTSADITAPMIEALVHTFYARVRIDPLPGPPEITSARIDELKALRKAAAGQARSGAA